VRRKRRFDFLMAIAKSQLPVRICGAGWDSQHSAFKHAVFDGPVEMTHVVELMRQSRIVLNTNGNFGAGSHERPFSASLAGAACFSDFSRYYAEVFRPGEDIDLFYWQDLRGGIEALHALAADPERALRQARRAKAKTLAGHTWDIAINHIIAAADRVRSA
jgi:spore maturation protein CgeB